MSSPVLLSDSSNRIRSVGIDVGTTTFQMVLTSFELVNVAPPLQAARYEIRDRRIDYAGQIQFTPLEAEGLDTDQIDLRRIVEMLRAEFLSAGVHPEELHTGAVIVTGLAANRENAEAIVNALALESGTSVATAAGPRLEAILAGRGAGAEERSRATHGPVLNIDVGGGTANLALFFHGQIVKTGALYVGGRLACLSPEGSILSGSKPFQFLCQRLHLDSHGYLTVQQLDRLCTELSEILDRFVFPKQYVGSLSDSALWLTEPLDLSECPEVITFSGGVAEYLYNPITSVDLKTITQYGDYGPLLGLALRKGKLAHGCRLETPLHTIRATVLGAGAHLVTISGSTITCDIGLLPLRDIPVVILNPLAGADAVTSFATEALTLRVGEVKDSNRLKNNRLAIGIPGIRPLTFYQARQLAEMIVAGLERIQYPRTLPVILLCEGDSGNVLGETVAMLRRDPLYPQQAVPVVALDRIPVSPGDYIDIAKPVAHNAIPVTVKTLVFGT